MFAPTRTWRRWHRKININQKRYAVASAIAASAIPALVLARGHQISTIPEVPLVVATDAVESLTKTKNALALLTKLKAEAEVVRCKNVQRHTGKARLRNRAKKIKVGPLVITGNKGTAAHKAFRNLAGVQVTGVWDLDLLKLAPGGHLGRFIIWTQAAFEYLNTLFGTQGTPSTIKRGYFLPRPVMNNPDVRRVIMSDTIQAVVKSKTGRTEKVYKPNYLTNKNALKRINPYAVHHKANEIDRSLSRHKARLAKLAAPKKPKKPLDKKKKDAKKAVAKKVGHQLSSFKKFLYAKYRKVVHGK